MYIIKEIELIKVFALNSFNTPPEEYNVENAKKREKENGVFTAIKHEYGIANERSNNIEWKRYNTLSNFLLYGGVGALFNFRCIKYFNAKNIYFRLPTILLGHKLFAKCFVQCGFSWTFYFIYLYEIHWIDFRSRWIIFIFFGGLFAYFTMGLSVFPVLFYFFISNSFTDNKIHSSILTTNYLTGNLSPNDVCGLLDTANYANVHVKCSRKKEKCEGTISLRWR